MTSGYRAAHKQVTATFGPARLYHCADCGSPAWDWSYDHRDWSELTDTETGLVYSVDPEHYIPRCRRCHSKVDGFVRAMKQHGFFEAGKLF